MNAQWIWHDGDWEVYHYLLLHARRQEFGHEYPAMWHTDSPEKTVSFRKSFHAETEGTLTARVAGQGYVQLDYVKYPTDKPIHLSAGDHCVEIRVTNVPGLPCVYVESDLCPSDGTWVSSPVKTGFAPVGTRAYYNAPSPTPETFPFAYAPIEPQSIQEVDGGTLYDFGRETFAKILLEGADSTQEVLVVYGESREEALDAENAILYERLHGSERYELVPRALRYLYVRGTHTRIRASYEYLPLPWRGAFTCGDALIRDVWQASAYTFHLNSREFFLDGIKRDRWVWSGDAYQSYFVNDYLFLDADIAQRTITALRGRNEVTEHINTILDYSLYWLISIENHYMTYGDAAFVRKTLPKMRSLMRYAEASRDENGFLVGGEGCWTFVDWADMDKTGAVCAEQMLYIRALKALAACEDIAGESGEDTLRRANDMLDKMNVFFWDEQQGAYVDSYTSGRRHVTRHANLFAILFDFADQHKKSAILERVLRNDAVPAITTPYFKFYELDVLGKLGYLEDVTRELRSYWGGMLRLGATTIWERFDPNEQGAEHYAMYQCAYGRSLCHAWGAGPVYLLGRYFLGVRPTAPGYATFDVAPCLGGLPMIEGTVPLPKGEVRVYLDQTTLQVTATCEGGTLHANGKRYPLEPNREIVVKIAKPL